MYTSRVLQDVYPAFTDSEQETTVDTHPSLAIATTRKNTQVVTLREAVAWALLSIMTLLFIGTLSVVTILRIQKYKQKRDNTAEAPGPAKYEMDGNPCYGSSKTDDYTYGNHIYEPIDTERL
jgi:hypothetical protein